MSGRMKPSWLRVGTNRARLFARPLHAVYPGPFLVNRVTNAGTFQRKHTLLSIANPLTPHHIGLEDRDDRIWSIYFGTALLAKVDERDLIVRDRSLVTLRRPCDRLPILQQNSVTYLPACSITIPAY
jgi:hypothetical protein